MSSSSLEVDDGPRSSPRRSGSRADLGFAGDSFLARLLFRSIRTSWLYLINKVFINYKYT